MMLSANHTLLKSNDGGESWGMCFDAAAADAIYQFAYPTVDTAYVFVEVNSSVNCSSYRSTDGGVSWTQLFTLHEYPTVSFYSGKYGYVAGSVPPSATQTLLRTLNAGAQYGTCLGNLPGASNGYFQFVNANIGFTGYSGSMYNTFDGGQNWTSIGTFQFFGRFSKNGIGFKIDGGIFKSTDYGTTWRQVFENTGGYDLREIDFSEEGLCAAATDGHIFISFDLGETWKDCVERSGPDIASYRFYNLTVIDNKNIICSGHEFSHYSDFVMKISF
jgi:photosystem II stability/assembly factor-like uncharacterized protein